MFIKVFSKYLVVVSYFYRDYYYRRYRCFFLVDGCGYV